MSDAGVITILADLLLVLPATAFLCVVYIAYVWWTDPNAKAPPDPAGRHGHRSAVLALLLLGAGAIDLMAFIIEPIAYARVFGILPPPGTTILIGIAFLVALAVPHVYAAYIARARRRQGGP